MKNQAAHKIFITDRHVCPNWQKIIAQLCIGDAVIVRDYDHPERANFAQNVAIMCRKKRIDLFIAADWRLARKLGAGLHIPEYMAARMGAAFTKMHIHPQRRTLMATHSQAAIIKAAAIGVMGVLISPVFASSPQKTPIGVIQFVRRARLAQSLGLRVYALGGMTAQKAHRLRHTLHTPIGWAGISAFQ